MWYNFKKDFSLQINSKKMFNFSFGKNKKFFLGIDIGASAIKIVELKEKNGKPYLSNYAWVEVPSFVQKSEAETEIFFGEVYPQYIKKALDESGVKSKEAYASISTSGSLIMVIDFPRMSKDELDHAIKFEAQKYIPVPLEEVAISWEIVGGEVPDGKTVSENSGNLQIFLAVVSKKNVLRYEKAVKNSGLDLKKIEIENISMAKSLVGDDKGKFVLLDIGFRSCNIAYVESGYIKINKSVDVGGIDLTRAIAESVGVSQERAETMKVSGQNFFDTKSSIRFPALEIILQETAGFLKNISKDGNKVEAIMLSGGTAALVGLVRLFEERLGIKTLLGNPFGRVECEPDCKKVLEPIRTKFAISAGLALQGFDDLAKKS